MHTQNVKVKTAAPESTRKMFEGEIEMRIYEVVFSGRDAKGVLPMFTRIKGATARAAQRAFVERFKPVDGWFLGSPTDVTDKVAKEVSETGIKA